ncbi:MAG: hypothetical protein J0H10_15915 [Alphaproteobacteria bacterium]|nr:hypothetical protein [Alphaproteobacteria bacterium]
MKVLSDGPAFQLRAVGVKCDAKGCDFSDPNIPTEHESFADYLDKPCPKCGAPLLTEADLTAIKKLERLFAVTNKIASDIGLEEDNERSRRPILIGFKGDGSMTFTIPASSKGGAG